MGVRLGVGFLVGVALAHGGSSHVGRGVLGAGRGAVDVGAGGRGGVERGVDGVLGGCVWPGNFGSSNRYSSGSSFNAAVASRMNWRHIGAGPLAPKTS